MRLLAWAALAVVLAGCSTPMRVDVSRLARSLPPPTDPAAVEFFAAPADVPGSYMAVAVLHWRKATRRNAREGLATAAAAHGADGLIFGGEAGSRIRIDAEGDAVAIRHLAEQER